MTHIQNRRGEYWTTWAASLLFFGAFYTLLVPLPRYLVSINMADWQTGVVLGVFGVAALVGRPLAGAWNDVWGVRRVLLAGAAALIVGAVGMSMTGDFAALVGLRLLQGLGYVCFTTAATAHVADLAEPARRGQMLAWFGAAANVAMTLTPASVEAALPVLTVRGAFWLVAGFALISAVLVLRLRPTSQTRMPANWRAMLAIPRPVWLPMLLSAIAGCAFGAFFQFMPLLVERRGDVSAGLLYTAYGIAIIATRLVTGRWIDIAAPHTVLRFAFLASVGGLLLLAGASATPALILAALLIAAGGGTQTPMLIRIHVERTPENARGRAVAWYYLGFDLGMSSGAWLLAPALEWLGISTLFLVAAAVTCSGIALAGLLNRTPQRDLLPDNLPVAQKGKASP
jgi:MFS family permease